MLRVTSARRKYLQIRQPSHLITTPDQSGYSGRQKLFSSERYILEVRRGITQAAVMTAVAEVNHQAYRQPDEKAQPVLGRERKHEQQATKDSQDRHDYPKRRAKWARHFGMSSPHDQDSCADNYERQQGTDVYEFGQNSQR
jgi:hypothetical protein